MVLEERGTGKNEPQRMNLEKFRVTREGRSAEWLTILDIVYLYAFFSKNCKGKVYEASIESYICLLARTPSVFHSFCSHLFFVNTSKLKKINVVSTAILYKHLFMYRKRVLICFHDKGHYFLTEI